MTNEQKEKLMDSLFTWYGCTNEEINMGKDLLYNESAKVFNTTYKLLEILELVPKVDDYNFTNKQYTMKRLKNTEKLYFVY